MHRDIREELTSKLFSYQTNSILGFSKVINKLYNNFDNLDRDELLEVIEIINYQAQKDRKKIKELIVELNNHGVINVDAKKLWEM